MALEEGFDEVVGYLTSFFLDGGKELSASFGDQAPALAQEMSEMLEERLNEDTPFGPLWNEFKISPEENEAELIGALEVLQEADPEITIRLEGFYAAFHKLQQPGVTELVESSEPEDTLEIEEIQAVNSNDDMDDDDEYREENTYLTGNVEDHSTSAMYYEDLDSSVEPNETEED